MNAAPLHSDNTHVIMPLRLAVTYLELARFEVKGNSQRATFITKTELPIFILKTFLVRFCFVLSVYLTASENLFAVIRDGDIDPNNLGQGGWIYILKSATNHLSPTFTASVTNEDSMFKYLKSQNLNYVIVKAATSNQLWTGSGNVPISSPANAQFTAALCNAAHANGLKIFGSNRSYGNDVPGEIAVTDYVFRQGADGFIWDAESEWESFNPWIGTNGPALAWQLCSTVRSNWPTKFLAHNPFDTLYLHSSFPYKEFGYWSDVVMPQVYHHSASKGNAFAAIHWTDVNYKRFQDSLATLPPTNINGLTVYWTNAIKPLVLMRDVYNGGANTPVHPDTDVRNFLDYLVADPNCVTAGGYNGSDYFRSELHSAGQWAYIRAATIGHFSNIVNNIVIDDANAAVVGAWTMVKTIDATTGSTVSFTGETGTDTNSFGTNYWRKAQGTGSDYMQFTPNIITAGDYDTYQWHPFRTNASASVPFVVNFNGGTKTVYANQQTNAGNWTLLGRFSFAAGADGTIRVLDNFPEATGLALVDGVKLVFAPPRGSPNPPSLLTASAAAPSQIALSWRDNATNESTFVVSRGTTAGGPYVDVVTLGPNTTNYTDGDLCELTPYYYVVRAANANFASTNSNEATATTPTFTPLILDNPDASLSGVWTTATAATDKYGSYYQYATTTVGGASSTAIYRPNISMAGKYNVYLWYSSGTNRTSNAQILISGISSSLASLNQTTGGGGWRLAGALQNFAVGTNGFVRISNDTGEINKIVVADAIQFEFINAPCLSASPQSQTVTAGSNVTFNVGVHGAPTLSYQWQFNGEDIPGATSSTLILSNLVPANSGNYSVIINNPAGGVVSEPAILSVQAQAANFNSASILSNNRIRLPLTGSAGVAYRIDGSTNLVDWTPLTNIFNADGSFEFIDSTVTDAQRFYRAIWSP